MKITAQPTLPSISFLPFTKILSSVGGNGQRRAGASGLRILSLIFLPGLLSISDISYATSIGPAIDNGFVHSSQLLPANAKGVLFLIDGPPAIYPIRNGKLKGALVLSEIVQTVSDKDFVIEERGTNRKLKVSITRLPADELLRDAPRQYFAVRTPSLVRCMAENRIGQNGCAEIETQSDRLIAKGDLYDATEEVRKAYGLFRISPLEGFIPGKEYVVRYSGALKNRGRQYSVNVTTTVTIDKTPWDALTKKAARLVIDNSAVKFRFPPAMHPYQSDMYAYTLLSLDNGTLPYVPLPFVTWPIEADVPVGNFPIPNDHYNAHNSWERRVQLMREYGIKYDIWEKPCHKAKGMLGFFEVEDTLSELPAIRVNCP